MNQVWKKVFGTSVSLVMIWVSGCTHLQPESGSIAGFSTQANGQLKEFLEKTSGLEGRKIAVFDGDGTVMGQTPHYLADECMYQYALKHPEQNKAVLEEITGQSNVSIPYVQNRIHYMAGQSLQFYRDLGEECFNAHYSEKIFEPIKILIQKLKKNGFEIWIVTASPEGMYQQFLSKEFQIPITHIIGVKSVIRHGLITDEIVVPIPQDHGKREAIETFIQDRPLLVAGNSRGDKEMIEFSQGLKIIVNPDQHIAEGQNESIADYARKNNWLTVYVDDIPAPDFPSVSSREFGIRLNKTHRNNRL